MFSHTLPYLTLPDLTTPRQSSPHRALPYLTQPGHTLTTKDNLTTPDPTTPDQAQLYPTAPRRSIPDLTLTTLSLGNLKTCDHKSTKARPKIANANGATGKGENLINNIMRYLVIQNSYLKIKFPPWLKARPNPHHPRPLNNDGANIEVQRLISIIVKTFGNFSTMQNFIRTNEHITLKQVFIGFASASLDFITSRCLDQATVKMGCGLVNVALRRGIKILAPFLAVILFARSYLAPFTNVAKVRQWKFMLHQWGDTFNRTINRVHIASLWLKAKRPIRALSLSAKKNDADSVQHKPGALLIMMNFRQQKSPLSRFSWHTYINTHLFYCQLETG